MNSTEIQQELVTLTHRLLESIFSADWETYTQLCDPSISAIEPEACGHVAVGMDFHKFYFDLEQSGGPYNITIASPHLRMLGDDAAVLAYTRLTQSLDANGSPQESVCQETRVWQKQNGEWKHVHFHRSAV